MPSFVTSVPARFAAFIGAHVAFFAAVGALLSS